MKRRGITLIETMATMAILIGGIGAVGMTVAGTSTLNRRNLRQSQALLLAERELARLTQAGCDGVAPLDPCANLKALDGAVLPPVFWAANGKLADTAGSGSPRARFDVAVDVDPPFEAAEVGVPSLVRPLAGSEAGNLVNVKVTVSWNEPDRVPQTMVLQTRVAP